MARRCVLVLVVGLLATLLSASAAGQRGEQQVTAVLSSGVVRLGGSVHLTLEAQDARSARIVHVPEVDGLSIGPPGAPTRSELTQVFGGRSTTRRSLRWTLPVRPERVGEFAIPPITLDIDGREVRTPELLLKVVRDLRGDELGFFEIVDPPARVYEGEPFDVVLRFGWDVAFDPYTAQLRLPWWRSMPGLLEMDRGPRSRTGRWLELAVNGREKVAVEQVAPTSREGRQFTVLELRRRFVATRSGRLDFPDSTFEFGRLVRRGDFFTGDEVEEFYAVLPGFTIEVAPVPEEGRPFDWTGAVGEIEASRRVDRRDVDVGESIELTVSWIGNANLEFFEPPDLSRLPSFEAFRVLGTEDEFLGDERRVTYDLVPVSAEADSIPPVPLSVFDTQRDAYRTLETEPVPIRVRALDSQATLAEEGGEVRRGTILDLRDIRTREVTDEPAERPGVGLVGGTLAGVVAAWLVGRTLVRRRTDPDSAEARRRRGARRRLARELARAPDALAEARALQRYLAARTGEGEQVWAGRDPLEWARGDARVQESDVRELAQLFEDLDARTWGDPARTRGAPGGDRLGPQRILAVVDRLRRAGL